MNQSPYLPEDRLLTAGEASYIARLSVTTLARYADRGIVQAVKTPTGFRRYRASSIHELTTTRKEN